MGITNGVTETDTWESSPLNTLSYSILMIIVYQIKTFKRSDTHVHRISNLYCTGTETFIILIQREFSVH